VVINEQQVLSDGTPGRERAARDRLWRCGRRGRIGDGGPQRRERERGAGHDLLRAEL